MFISSIFSPSSRSKAQLRGLGSKESVGGPGAPRHRRDLKGVNHVDSSVPKTRVHHPGWFRRGTGTGTPLPPPQSPVLNDVELELELFHPPGAHSALFCKSTSSSEDQFHSWKIVRSARRSVFTRTGLAVVVSFRSF